MLFEFYENWLCRSAFCKYAQRFVSYELVTNPTG